MKITLIQYKTKAKAGSNACPKGFHVRVYSSRIYPGLKMNQGIFGTERQLLPNQFLLSFVQWHFRRKKPIATTVGSPDNPPVQVKFTGKTPLFPDVNATRKAVKFTINGDLTLIGITGFVRFKIDR